MGAAPDSSRKSARIWTNLIKYTSMPRFVAHCLLRIRFRLLPLAVLLLWLSACGKMGDPVPANVILPPTVQDLAVEEVAGRSRLTFTLPRQVEWVEIYRQCDTQVATPRFNLIAQVNPDELDEAAAAGRYAWLDLQRTAACRYALKFVDFRGQRSEYSNFAP